MPTTVRLDPKTENLLKRLAKKTGRTKSQVIREAIERLAEREIGPAASATPYEKIAHLIGRIKGGPRMFLRGRVRSSRNCSWPGGGSDPG